MTRYEAMKARFATAREGIPSSLSVVDAASAMARNEAIRKVDEFERHAYEDMKLLIAVVDAAEKFSRFYGRQDAPAYELVFWTVALRDALRVLDSEEPT